MYAGVFTKIHVSSLPRLTQHCNPTACHAYMLKLFDFVFPNNKLSRFCPVELTFCFFSSAVVHSIITETVRAAVRSSGSVIKSFRSQYCNTKPLLVFSTDPLHQSRSTVPLDHSRSLRLGDVQGNIYTAITARVWSTVDL